MTPPLVSVIIPLRELNEYLRQALERLSRQTFTDFDVFVITNQPERMDVPDNLRVTFLHSGPVPPNRKRLQAAQQSQAEIVALLDDDAYPAQTWLEAAVARFADPSVAGVGGPAVTPPSDDAQQQASGAVYASALVSASYTYRYRPSREREVDDYPSCNLLLRRELFVKHAPQCLRYWPGEDTKLCMLVINASHGRIVYDPDVLVYHHRRRLFWGHFRQTWNYAVHRGFFAKRYPQTSLRLAYFIPTLFLVSNAIFIILVALAPTRWFSLVLAAIYAVTVLGASFLSLRDHQANPVAVAAGIYLTHLTYGVGFLAGLTRRELDH